MKLSAVALSLYSLLILRIVVPDLLVTQAVALGIGILLYLAVERIDPRFYEVFWPACYVLQLVLLLLTFLGPEIRGSQRWIGVGAFSFQPVEITKPLIIISLAGFLATRPGRGFRQAVILALLLAVPALLVFRQPDLGNAIVLTLIGTMLLFGAGFGLRYLIIPAIVMTTLVPYLWRFLADYQKIRITSFINPSFDVQGAGYNARQALIAVGSGGLFGKGLGEGTQSKLQFLPEFHTDFIFATIVEQLGFIGGIVVLLLYFWLLVQLLRKGRTDYILQRLMVLGLFAQLLAQSVINIGMNLGIMPITGITLPFVSYGGSSMISLWVSLAVIDSFRRQPDQMIAIR